MNKYKILLSAYACEPNKGSEPEVGWMWAITLSQLGHEVHVVTRLNNKQNIEELINNKKFKNLYFHYFDYPNWIIKLIKKKSNPHSYVYFFIWQIGIFFSTRPLIKKKKFDFIQHITFVSLRFPSFLCLYNIPFIFGPVSGGDTIPKQLMKEFSFYSKFKEFIRNLSNRYIQISPLMNLTFLNSKKILVNNAETKKLIPYIYHHKIEEMLAVGMNNNGSHKIKLDKDNSVFNICFAGNLIELKGILIVLKTFSSLKVKNHNIKLTIIGSGPYELKFKKAAIKLQIEKDVNWLGKIERDELLSIFNKSDLLLYPSLRDSGGLVVLEALSQGLPVATLNLGGPGEIINNDCGIKIDVNNKSESQIIFDLTAKIEQLIKNEIRINYLRNKSLERINHYSWINKALRLYK